MSLAGTRERLVSPGENDRVTGDTGAGQDAAPPVIGCLDPLQGECAICTRDSGPSGSCGPFVASCVHFDGQMVRMWRFPEPPLLSRPMVKWSVEGPCLESDDDEISCIASLVMWEDEEAARIDFDDRAAGFRW